MSQKRRIRRGPRKSDIEVTPQWVEDLVARRLKEAMHNNALHMNILINKSLFVQHQLEVAGKLLNNIQEEAENRTGRSTRESIADMARMLSGVFTDLMEVNSPEEFANLSTQDIEAHLEKHYEIFGIMPDEREPDDYDEIEDDVDEEYVAEEVAVDYSTEEAARRGYRRAQERRTYPVEDEEVDDEDIISAVSDEVQEDFITRRRRRRRT